MSCKLKIQKHAKAIHYGKNGKRKILKDRLIIEPGLHCKPIAFGLLEAWIR